GGGGVSGLGKGVFEEVGKSVFLLVYLRRFLTFYKKKFLDFAQQSDVDIQTAFPIIAAWQKEAIDGVRPYAKAEWLSWAPEWLIPDVAPGKVGVAAAIEEKSLEEVLNEIAHRYESKREAISARMDAGELELSDVHEELETLDKDEEREVEKAKDMAQWK